MRRRIVAEVMRGNRWPISGCSAAAEGHAFQPWQAPGLVAGGDSLHIELFAEVVADLRVHRDASRDRRFGFDGLVGRPPWSLWLVDIPLSDGEESLDDASCRNSRDRFEIACRGNKIHEQPASLP
jgi:hypothetical protein